jgi:hypothetical protein
VAAELEVPGAWLDAGAGAADPRDVAGRAAAHGIRFHLTHHNFTVSEIQRLCREAGKRVGESALIHGWPDVSSGSCIEVGVRPRISLERCGDASLVGRHNRWHGGGRRRDDWCRHRFDLDRGRSRGRNWYGNGHRDGSRHREIAFQCRGHRVRSSELGARWRRNFALTLVPNQRDVLLGRLGWLLLGRSFIVDRAGGGDGDRSFGRDSFGRDHKGWRRGRGGGGGRVPKRIDHKEQGDANRQERDRVLHAVLLLFDFDRRQQWRLSERVELGRIGAERARFSQRVIGGVAVAGGERLARRVDQDVKAAFLNALFEAEP